MPKYRFYHEQMSYGKMPVAVSNIGHSKTVEAALWAVCMIARKALEKVIDNEAAPDAVREAALENFRRIDLDSLSVSDSGMVYFFGKAPESDCWFVEEIV